jgi:hypothetical protein
MTNDVSQVGSLGCSIRRRMERGKIRRPRVFAAGYFTPGMGRPEDRHSWGCPGGKLNVSKALKVQVFEDKTAQRPLGTFVPNLRTTSNNK